MARKHRFVQRRRVEFADTDLAGIMHFSNFFRFMEVTEHAFYRSLGFTVHEFRPGPDEARIGWPRVHAEADYKLPLRFEEEVEVELLVEEIRGKSLHYRFRFWSDPDGESKVAAVGKFSVVCVQFDETNSRMAATVIPDAVRDQIEVAPPEVLDLSGAA